MGLFCAKSRIQFENSIIVGCAKKFEKSFERNESEKRQFVESIFKSITIIVGHNMTECIIYSYYEEENARLPICITT